MPPPPYGVADPGAPPRPEPCAVPCARSWHALVFSSGFCKLLVRSSHCGTAWNRPYQHCPHRPGSGRHTPKSGRMSPKSEGRTPRGRHSPPPNGASSSAEKPAGGESAREESIRRSSAKQAAEKGGGEAAGRREAKEAKPAGSASASRKPSKSGGGSSKAPARSGAEVAAEVDRLHLSSRPPVVRPEDVRFHPEPWRTLPCTDKDIAKRGARQGKSPIVSIRGCLFRTRFTVL